jgi:hypothetical protein
MTATMKNAVLWVVRQEVSEKRITSIIRVIRIGELGTTLAGTINRSTLRALFCAVSQNRNETAPPSRVRRLDF